MPTNPNTLGNGRRAAYSVVEVAKLCRLSRARFYDLLHEGAMPSPVYDLRTRRPIYTVELAAKCVEVRETNIGIDGRFVMFYEPRNPIGPAMPATPASQPARRRQATIDPLVQEMFEALRTLGVNKSETDMSEAILRCCPRGLAEDRFDLDLLLIRADLQRTKGV